MVTNWSAQSQEDNCHHNTGLQVAVLWNVCEELCHPLQWPGSGMEALQAEILHGGQGTGCSPGKRKRLENRQDDNSSLRLPVALHAGPTRTDMQHFFKSWSRDRDPAHYLSALTEPPVKQWERNTEGCEASLAPTEKDGQGSPPSAWAAATNRHRLGGC